MAILDNFSIRLTEIPGLGKKRVAQIKEVWKSHSARRDSFVYLQGLGVSTAYCHRLFKVYGDDTPQVVADNPYKLASEVKGIGFKMADAIATKLNIAKDNPFRLGSGINYLLRKKAEVEGHTCFPRGLLLSAAAEVLDVTEEVAEIGLLRAIKDGAVREIAGNNGFGNVLVASTNMYHIENRLAEAVIAKARNKPENPPDISTCASQHWNRLNVDQQRAIIHAFNHRISIITGGPGVGKTTVTYEIVAIANHLNYKIALAAPTGRAAKRLSELTHHPAQTIHRLLKWEPERQSFAYNENHLLPFDCIIIDEVSMVDVVLARYLFAALMPNARIILVGDRDQLPSIGAGSFLGDLIKSKCINVNNLTRIYRQNEGSKIITNAHLVNSGRLPELTISAENLSDFYWIDQDDQEKVIDLIGRLVAERIPKRFNLSRLTDIQVLTPMNRGACGTHSLNRHLQNLLNPAVPGNGEFKFGESVFRVKDRVMQILNNYDLGVFNGDLGIVERINVGDKMFQVNYNGDIVSYSFDESDQIRLAYATTIHKSQGNEFPAVIVPLLTQHLVMLKRNLIYTAMTRASKLLILVGSRKALALAVNNYRVSTRYTRLADLVGKLKSEI